LHLVFCADNITSYPAAGSVALFAFLVVETGKKRTGYSLTKEITKCRFRRAGKETG
jgi:hypothetical protein